MTDWKSEFVEANGLRLHYHRTGGNGLPFVLAHGITDNGLCWSRMAKALADSYDIIMVDARGHGLSDKPERGYTATEHAADLAGLIESLDIGPALVMGHSMGGLTATVLMTEFPHLVRAGIVEDPVWREESATDEERRAGAEAWAADIANNRKLPLEELIRRGKERSPGWAEEEFPAWAASKQQVSPNVTELVAHPLADWKDQVARFTCPVLLATGDVEKGAIVSPEIAAQAQAINPLVQVVHLPQAGHNIRREAFQPFLDAVIDFLEQLP